MCRSILNKTDNANLSAYQFIEYARDNYIHSLLQCIVIFLIIYNVRIIIFNLNIYMFIQCII